MRANTTPAKEYFRQQFNNQQKLAAARAACSSRRKIRAKQEDRSDPIYAAAERERNRLNYRQRRLHAANAALAA